MPWSFFFLIQRIIISIKHKVYQGLKYIYIFCVCVCVCLCLFPLTESSTLSSLQPHRQQPTRLPRPWDSPGKNTGVVAVSFSNARKWKVKVKSLSPVRLLSTPWIVAYQAPPSMGFSRQEYWSGLPLPSLQHCPSHLYIIIPILGFLGGSVVNNLPINAGDAGSISRLERSPGEGNANPLQ